jgi:hypothetical protein
MEQFYVIVITTVVVLLIVILTYIYVYVINDDDKKIKFPPTENKCPDNWEENEHGRCIIPHIDHSNFGRPGYMGLQQRTLSNKFLIFNRDDYYGFYDNNNNKIEGPNGNPDSIDFSGVKTCIEGGKYWFTRVFGISWDGVSNNSCKI